MKNYFKIILWVILLAFVGCQNSDKLTISGNIANVDNDTLTIKRLVNNELTVIDSKVLKKSGNFKFSIEKQRFPQYYFLQINEGKQLVVMRDSSDLIKIKADSPKLLNATIEGSDVSVRIQEMMQRVSCLRTSYYNLKKEVNEEEDVARKKALTDSFIVELDSVKTFITSEIYKNPKSYYAYYALFQRLDNENLLFSPYNDKDYHSFAMVATAYDMCYKKDPRTKALYEMVEGVLAERRSAKLKQIVENAPGGLPDIVMNDNKGVEHKLSDLKGYVVILNFWASKSPDARVINKELLKLYDAYKGRGLKIFQVSADKSKILWENAIDEDKLPWINVCDFKESACKAIQNYNIKEVPTTFLIDREGNMIDKFTNVLQLETAIQEAL